MPDHESWCCRSPQSPCTLEGGCAGSCNCGADESIEVLGPSLGELRAASANMMALGLAASLYPLMQNALKAAVERDSYLVNAQTIGVCREDAERVLAEIIEDRSHRGLPLEPSIRLAWEKVCGADAYVSPEQKFVDSLPADKRQALMDSAEQAALFWRMDRGEALRALVQIMANYGGEADDA